MKISTLVLAIVWCLSFTIIVNDAKGQQVLKKRLSISFENESLHKALDKIAAATGVKFTYNGSVVNSTVKVSLRAKNQELHNMLDEMFNNIPYTYELLDGEILVKYDEHKKYVLKPSLQVLTGHVYDDKGAALPGATVRVIESGTGMVTDTNGLYTIKANLTDRISFSFVGFKQKEMNAAGLSKRPDIRLQPDSSSNLQEVAVVAYGTQSKISLIGAQSTVSVDDLKQPVADLTSLLAGRVSGIVGVQRSGQPGKDAASIYIRGLSSFVSSSNISPLILIDGVERAIDAFNIDDVQSLTILKDASATAVYGVRGANGVILLQTKRGKPGKTIVKADYYDGISMFTKTPQMADGITYMQTVNEALTTRGQSPKYTAAYIANTKNNTDPLLYPNVNWLDAIFNKTSHNRKANLNISGGSATAAYYISGSYLDQTGLLKTDQVEQYDAGINFSRYNFVSNVDLQVSSTTKVFLGLNGYIAKGNYPSQEPSAIFGYAMTVPPTEFPTTYPGGFVPGKTANGSEPNPYGQLTRSGYSTEYNSLLNAQVRITQGLGMVLKGLNFSGMLAYDTNSAHAANRYKNPDTWQPDAQKPYNEDGSLNLVKTSTGTGSSLSFSTVDSGNHNFYLESSLNYSNQIANHRFGGLLLFNQQEARDYPVTSYMQYIPHRQRGFAGRVTYSYNNKYFAEVNAGYNGTNNFAPGHRFGFFPAYGVGWLISEEQFFADLKSVISMLKIRYSDGFVGSDDTAGPRFAYLTILREGATGYTFGLNRNGVSGIEVNTYGITTTWSTSHKQNLGVDVNIADRLNLSVDVFKERRKNVIMQRGSVPLYIGLTTTPFANVGIISNKGIDATLAGQFNWRGIAFGLRGTVTCNKAIIINNDTQAAPYPWMNRTGHSPIATFGYIADGLFTSQEEINKSAVPGDKTILKPGDIKYRDLNNDGLINAYDMTAIAEGDLPRLMFGAGFNTSYRGFFVNAYFVGNAKAKRYISGTAIQPFSTNGGISNAYANISDRWTEANPSQDVFYPRLAYGNAPNANNTAISSWWVKDVGFVRLKTLDVGYNLPKKLFSKLSMSNAAVYFEGYNILTFSNFKLWDPELGTNNGTQYPNVKTLVVGIRAQFN